MAIAVHELTYRRLFGDVVPPLIQPLLPMQGSRLCKQADFASDCFRYWCGRLKQAPALARKAWELVFIAQSLSERGLLAQGRRGLAFGVGREPLPALFASLGCNIVATDQEGAAAIRAGWQQTNQHAAGLEALEYPEICDLELFRKRVTFQTVDMNHVPSRFQGGFDFCWSTCSLEHLGSLEHGLDFIESAMETLKEGGVGVHTTEFNLSSNEDTLETRDLSLYRRRDIQRLVSRLTRAGHDVHPVDYDPGEALIDGYVDLPPYRHEPHLRLRIAKYDCTSIGLIVARRPPGEGGFSVPLSGAARHNSARVELRDAELFVTSPDPIWSYAASFDLRGTLRKLGLSEDEAFTLACTIKVQSGAIGLALSDADGVRFVTDEVRLEPSPDPQIVTLSSTRARNPALLIIRNALGGESACRISAIRVAAA
jgi:hypothetical protein